MVKRPALPTPGSAPEPDPGAVAAPSRAEGVQWDRWSVILLKPDCVQRGLVDDVLACLGEHVEIRGRQEATVTEEQIFAHYDDMLAPQVSTEFGLDVAADLRRLFVGRQVCVALGHGPAAPARLRELIGPTDPSLAGAATIRGRFGIDSLTIARSEGRLIDNLIHTSDNAAVVERDFGIWYGPSMRHLLTPTADRSTT
ncbi:nucleoside-diphosphate kinase [Nonomuraea sp. NPDC049400]|uniref:nucleoside-diphosphate kinase n=1 Tax=Nonomuraea sp. NPDC049400 TaxID=3364352 RepID=UPI0037B9252F